ncbi:glycosyltransferase [Fibrobacterota bacterium]
MRIAFVSTHPPIECGIGTYTSYLNDALIKLHNETFIISHFGAQGHHVIPTFSPQSDSLAADVFDICDKMTPDLVHIQHEFGLYGAQKGVQIAELILRYRIAGEPVVITLHTVKPEIPEDEKVVLRVIVSECSAVIVHEDFQKQTLVNNFGHADKIHVVPHGIRTPAPIPNARKKIQVQGKKVILMCGYFRPTKGFHNMVEWFPEIRKNCKNVTLLIAGKSRGLQYREYQKRFFECINNSPENENIQVLRGQFPQHTFDTIISAADAVVLPYEDGAQSGVLAQCFAFNKPVLVSNLPAFKNIIKQSGGGIVCNTKKDFIDNIIKVISRNGLKNKMRNNIHKFVKNHNNWGMIAKRHIDIYHSVVNVPYGKARHVFWEE